MFRRIVVVFAFPAAFLATIAMAAPPVGAAEVAAGTALPASAAAGQVPPPAATSDGGAPGATAASTGASGTGASGTGASGTGADGQAPIGQSRVGQGPTGQDAPEANTSGANLSHTKPSDTKPSVDGGAAPLSAREARVEALQQAVGSPARARLGDIALDRLSYGLYYFPAEAAKLLLTTNGHAVAPDLIGLVLGIGGMRDYASVQYVAAGHIDADTALRWTARDYLSSISDKVRQENKALIAQHLEPREARRWVWPPHYDKARHQLQWAALVVPKDAPPESGGLVVYHALAFGRSGYIAVTVRASDTKAAGIQEMVDSFMANLRFLPGQGYADATPADRRAPGGLAAAMGLASLHKAPVHVKLLTSRIFIPLAGGVVAFVALVAGALLGYRRFKRNARRG